MDHARMLIIDDDTGLRKTLADILRAKGYEVLAAKDGTEGLTMLKENSANLALIDLGLPDMSGLDVLARVRADHPSTEAIILTGNATLDSAIEATNKGAFSYLLKPYDIDQVLLHIRRALEKQQAEERIVLHSAELERANAELKALHEISIATNRTIDLDRLLSDVLLTIAETRIFTIDMKAAIFLVEGEFIRLASHIGFTEAAVEHCRSIRLGDCLCGRAAASGEILVSKDSGQDERHGRCLPGTVPHGHVIIPLKAAETVIGVLDFYIPPDMEFDERALDMFSSIGGQIGIAISNARLYEETKSSSLHDPLTRLANRRLLDIQLEKCIEATKRYGSALSVIMLDIDHFKKYNDTFGHPEGDRLLVKIAGILLREMRSSDHVFRYGGEEFLIILTQTGLPMACDVAERLRKTVETETEVTISLGIAAYHETMRNKEALIAAADKALYLAKQNGRNRAEAAKREQKGELHDLHRKLRK